MIALNLAQHDVQTALTAAFIHPAVSASCLKVWTQRLVALHVSSKRGYKLAFDHCEKIFKSNTVRAIRIIGMDSDDQVVYQAYIMEHSKACPTEVQIQSVSMMDPLTWTDDIYSMTILDGRASLNVRTYFWKLTELILVNATSSSLYRRLGFFHALAHLYFFSDQGSSDYKSLHHIVVDSSAEYPVWLTKALYSLRRSVKHLYFVSIEANEREGVIRPWVQKIAEKKRNGHRHNKDKKWNIIATHYVFYCNKSMR